MLLLKKYYEGLRRKKNICFYRSEAISCGDY